MSDSSGGRHACLVGWGAATAIGESAAATAAAVRAGIAGFVEHPRMVDMNRDPFVVAAAPAIQFTTPVAERMAILAESAVTEAIGAIDALDASERRIAVKVGLPEGRPGQVDSLARTITSRLHVTLQGKCQVESMDTLAHGHAAGMMAIAEAAAAIEQGAADFFLVGGVDSYIDEETLGWLEDCGQLHNGVNPYGFTPGEAAGFTLLCAEETAQQLELRPQATLLTAAKTNEPFPIKTDTVSTGTGMTAAYRQVFASLATESQVHQIITDQNGEIYRANEYGFSLVRTNRHFVDGNEFLAPADCWGDVGAASGPLFLGLAATAAEKGYAKGPLTLLTTSAEAGQRCVALAHAVVQPKGPA